MWHTYARSLMVVLTNTGFATILGEGERKDRHHLLIAGFGPNEQGSSITATKTSIMAKSLGQVWWW